MKLLVRKLFEKFGYRIIKDDPRGHYPDIEPEFWNFYQFCQPFTMTSIDRMYALYKATLYVVDHGIKGDLVECGVWKGGSAMMMARILSSRGVSDKKIYLYDTFEGMSEPGSEDQDFRGLAAEKLLSEASKEESFSVWAYSPIEEVRKNLESTGYHTDNLIFVKGKVEDTLPHTMPQQISLLRLDTDWYDSTYHELKHLYPLLVKSGVLIIDDYGHWKGSKKAVDDFFAETNIPILLNRIDYTGRVAVKS